MEQKTRTILVLTAIAWLVSGCATPKPSANVKPLTRDNAAPDLKKYHIATVVPFDSHNEGVKDPAIGEVFGR